MKWFKHMSNMRHDVKLKRVIRKYGLKGYGLYNLVVEAITERIETGSPLPILEETAEDIADIYHENLPDVEEMIRFMVDQELLSMDAITGRIVCQKVYKFIAQSETRSNELRKMITEYKEQAGGDYDNVYIMQGPNGYKIGKAVNPTMRRKELENELGFDIRMIATLQSGYAYTLEAKLHNDYKELRQDGEWFDISQETVKKIIEEHGFTIHEGVFLGVTGKSDRVTNVTDKSEERHELCEEQNRREENRKEEKEETPRSPSKVKHPELRVPINKSRYESLTASYGKQAVDDYIQRAIDYTQAKGKKPYADYAATAAQWIKRDTDAGKGPQKKANGTYIAECKACGHQNNQDADECDECGSGLLRMRKVAV